MSSEVAKEIGVTPTSGEVRLGKIPFSARGSPMLDCRTATNSELASLVTCHS